MSATSAQILAVKNDLDLRERLEVFASLAGVPDPQSWVEGRIIRLATVSLGSSGTDTIASVLDYARAEYRPYGPNPIRPGENPGAVTDDHIRTAITTVLDETPEG